MAWDAGWRQGGGKEVIDPATPLSPLTQPRGGGAGLPLGPAGGGAGFRSTGHVRERPLHRRPNAPLGAALGGPTEVVGHAPAETPHAGCPLLWLPTCFLSRVFRSVSGHASVLLAVFDRGRSNTTRSTPNTPSVRNNHCLNAANVERVFPNQRKWELTRFPPRSSIWFLDKHGTS